MAKLKLEISSAKSADTLLQEFERSQSSKYDSVQSMAAFLESILAGNESQPSVEVSVDENEDRASGTFTLASVVATDAVVINGVTFTAVASGATGNQFNVGADDTETAENLAAAINASVTALVAGYVEASSALHVVTVTSAFPGKSGNQTTIVSNDATITASGARLAGGAPDPDAKTYSF